MIYPDYHGPSIESIDKQLLRFGLNDYKRPRYRFVLASRVTEVKGGRWEEYEDYVPVSERGVKGGVMPTRIVTEYREIQKYPEDSKQGWVLERWTPRSVYGSPERWDDPSVYVPGTTINQLGPYPHEGKYEWALGPLPEVPLVSFLLDWITAAEAKRENMDQDLARVVRTRYAEAQLAQQKADQKLTEENAARLRDAMSPLLSTSLAAGRWRSEMFERAGFRSHIGN